MKRLKLRMPKIAIERNWKLTAGIALVLFGSFGVVLGLAVMHAPKPPHVATPAERAAYKQQLQSQVDGSDGAPQDGRNPAAQQQTSLASAASKPTGSGLRTDTPAAGVTGDTHSHVTSSDVYGDPNVTGINDAGCFIDYGAPGAQCVQAHLAVNGKLTCEGVHKDKDFKDGVKVTGNDRFNLDKNHDGTACGAND